VNRQFITPPMPRFGLGVDGWGMKIDAIIWMDFWHSFNEMALSLNENNGI
jgi:hypothetical protein